jgi:hypothetical protein
LISVAGLFHGLKQHFPYAPQINAEQKSDSALKGDEKSEKEKNATATHQKYGGENPQERENEAPNTKFTSATRDCRSGLR